MRIKALHPSVFGLLSLLLLIALHPLICDGESRVEIISPTQGIHLPATKVLVLLDRAEVSLSFDASKEAFLGYGIEDQNTEATSDSVALQCTRKGSGLSTVERIDPGTPDSGEAPRLIVQLHLVPGQALEVQGEDLDISTSGFQPAIDADGTPGKPDESPVTEADPEGGTDFPFSFEIREGRLRLGTFSPSAHIVGKDSTIELVGTRRPMTLELEGGQLKISGTRAPIEVTASDAVLDLDTEASTDLHLRNTRVTATGSPASLSCDALNSYFDLYELGGNLKISGFDSTINLSGARLQRADISGENQTLSLEGRGQLLRTDLYRSSASIPSWSGRIETTLRGASSFELKALDGDCLFSIRDDSELKLNGITGHLRGQSHDSTMVLSHLKSMEVDIWNTRLEVSELLEITKLGAFGSEAEISAPKLRAEPKISLQEGSSLELELPAPCVIELKDPIDDWSSVLDAPNCGIQVRGQLSGNLSRSQRGGPQPIKAEVVIDSSSYMRAEVPL